MNPFRKSLSATRQVRGAIFVRRRFRGGGAGELLRACPALPGTCRGGRRGRRHRGPLLEPLQRRALRSRKQRSCFGFDPIPAQPGRAPCTRRPCSYTKLAVKNRSGLASYRHTSTVFPCSNARHRRAPAFNIDFLCYNKTGLERRGRRSRRPLATSDGAQTSLCSTSSALT